MTQTNALIDFFQFEDPIPESIDQIITFEENLNPQCPICLEEVKSSDFLWDVFVSDQGNWYSYAMAVFITHYRHNHQKSWDKLHSSFRYQKTLPRYEYNEQKKIYNNKAKRQLIRAIMKSNHYHRDIKVQLISSLDFLLYNDEKTKELMINSVQKLLGVEN